LGMSSKWDHVTLFSAICASWGRYSAAIFSLF
jgi:hypothetical protein